eukprot:1144103-Pelagomonas_calceolata.AAC.5
MDELLSIGGQHKLKKVLSWALIPQMFSKIRGIRAVDRSKAQKGLPAARELTAERGGRAADSSKG